ARREETNILYVALTRARDALFVLGAETSRKGERQSYLDWIQAAARMAPSAAAAAAGVAAAAVPESDSPGAPFQLEAPAWLADPDRDAAEPITRLEPSSGVAGKRETYRVWEPPPKRPALRVEVPSAADEILALDLSGGPAAAITADPVGPALSRVAAIEHGEAVHLWLQRATERGTMPIGDGPAWQEAEAVYTNPEFAWIFHPEAAGGRGYAEVPVIHRLPPVTRAPDGPATELWRFGVIDRLVLPPGRAVVVDYKTTRRLGSVADLEKVAARYTPQLDAYRQAIQVMYPEREVTAGILFTEPAGESGRGRLVNV
ncbi:MAG: PD-(D/E)XK nuclease family protein, partial [bacterium]